MMFLQSEVYREFLEVAETHLRGDWVLMGGALLPVLGREYRTTADIDLVPLGGDSNQNLGQTMELAERLGLPYEAINSAGAYFLAKIPEFEKHLVELSCGSETRILRPDVFLYVSLKISRLTDSDCEDCIQFIEFAKGCPDRDLLDVTRSSVKKAFESCEHAAKRKRLGKIIAAFPG